MKSDVWQEVLDWIKSYAHTSPRLHIYFMAVILSRLRNTGSKTINDILICNSALTEVNASPGS